MGFEITSLQRNRGPVQARSRADAGRAVLKYIDVDDLVPSEDNFYSMTAIEELASLIELSGGVKQPALVTPLGGGKYKVIAGHRRRLASIQLVKQGKEVYRKVPCMVEDDEREPGADAEVDELRDIDEAILLITTNGQRDKTDWDKVQEATRLRALLDRKRRFEKIPGETRKLIAEQLGTTPAQVGRYDSIEKHLIPYFKDLLAKGAIGISLAYDLSTMMESLQHSAMLFHEKNGVEKLKILISEWKENTKKLKAAVDELPPVQPGPPVKMVVADEIGPAPTPEQAAEILERAKDRTASGAVVLPKKPEDEAGAPPVQWDKWRERAGVENGGKIVDFPAPPSPTPAEAAPPPEKEPMHKRMAANILEDLQMYCKEMAALEPLWVATWLQRVDALAVAIAVLRK